MDVAVSKLPDARLAIQETKVSMSPSPPVTELLEALQKDLVRESESMS